MNDTSNKLIEFGWMPINDDPHFMRQALKSNQIITKYPYIIKSILLTAIQKNHKKVVSCVLNETNPLPLDSTELCLSAALEGKKEILENLLHKGFKTSPKDPSDLSIVDAAARNNQIEILEVLKKHNLTPNKTSFSDLCEAVLFRSYAAGEWILEFHGMETINGILKKEIDPFETREKYINDLVKKRKSSPTTKNLHTYSAQEKLHLKNALELMAHNAQKKLVAKKLRKETLNETFTEI